MNIWISIIIAGVINYLSRLGSVLLIKPERLNENTKKILSYVPSAVFPAIIFPAVFLNESNTIFSVVHKLINLIIVANKAEKAKIIVNKRVLTYFCSKFFVKIIIILLLFKILKRSLSIIKVKL